MPHHSKGPRQEILPAQGQPPSARLCSRLSRAQRLPIPCCPLSLWHQVCLHRARVQEVPHSFPWCTHPGFDQVSGKREGDKEWDPYLTWRVSLAWSTACSCVLARAVSTWHAHTHPFTLLVRGPDVQVWAGPAGRPAWARPALSCRMLGRRDQLVRDFSRGPLRARVCTPGAGAVCQHCRMGMAHSSLHLARVCPTCCGFSQVLGILVMLSIPSCCCCKEDQGEPQDSDEVSTGIQPMHQP